jgi:ribose transport system substrate-binding protein
MKKLLTISLVIMLVLALMLTGCTSKVEEPATEASADEPAEEAAEEPVQELVVGEILSTGPNGETATPASALSLTDEEVVTIKEGGYKAAIVFHYAGNDWSSAQQKGLEDTFANMGIEVVAVTDANFSAEQQVSDIETVMALSPDIIISIPTDPVATSPAFKQAAAAGATIVFMDNCPANMTAGEDYVSVVSADNYGNGVAAADIMAKEIGEEGKVGVIYFDADFFVTNQRVEAFIDTMNDKYPNIEIVEELGFEDPNKVSEVADAMLTKNPAIDGIFGVWDVPAEAIYASAIAAGRDDLIITTIDLGNNAARMIAEGGMLKGLGAQLPYDQGVAEATLAAYSLLGKDAPAYVAVSALPVTHDNVLEAYKTVYHTDAPDVIQDAYK